jgi:hypothetical protein
LVQPAVRKIGEPVGIFRYAYLDLERQRTSASQSPCREGLDSAQNQPWQSRVSIWETLSLHRKGRLKIPRRLFHLGDQGNDHDAAQRGSANF